MVELSQDPFIKNYFKDPFIKNYFKMKNAEKPIIDSPKSNHGQENPLEISGKSNELSEDLSEPNQRKNIFTDIVEDIKRLSQSYRIAKL